MRLRREEIMPVEEMSSKLEQILGEDAAPLLRYQCKVPKENLHLPGPDYVERIYGGSDRPTRVLSSLQSLIGHGRLAGTGYVSILPVDQGIEHSAGASFAPNPLYFDPENLVKLAIEGGCNAVASTLRVRSDSFRERPPGVRHGRGKCWRDDLFRVGRIEAPDSGSHRHVPAGARTGHVHDSVVLPPEQRLQDEGRRLPRGCRLDGAGQPPRRDDRS